MFYQTWGSTDEWMRSINVCECVCVNKNDYFIFFVQHHIFVSFTLLYVLQRQ